MSHQGRLKTFITNILVFTPSGHLIFVREKPKIGRWRGMKRSEKMFLKLPGGHSEKDDLGNIQTSAARELKEETGISVEPDILGSPICISITNIMEKIYVFILYLDSEPTVEIGRNEISEIEFLTEDDILNHTDIGQEIRPVQHRMLEKLLAECPRVKFPH